MTYYKQLTKEEFLANLYIHTNNKFSSNKASGLLIIEFYQYSGLFYYYNTYARFDVTDEIREYFDLTIEEMLLAVNSNTQDDFILLPMDRYGMYQLIDKNGDSVERILLNASKIDSYLRTIDDGFGIELYPVRYNKWLVIPAPISEDDTYVNEYRLFIKEQCKDTLNQFYLIDSNGEIEEKQF